MDTKQFKPAWWLKNTHLQTIWSSFCRRDVKGLQLQRERIELPDGDFVDLDWVNQHRKNTPTVLILHGFEGSIESHYAKGTLRCIAEQGWRGTFMHFRGCSGEPNRLVRGYHSGATEDVDYIVRLLHERESQSPLAAVGYSLGGNILLKWMGETKNKNPLTVAIGISVPFDLPKASKRIETGFSRFYQWYLVKSARDRLIKKFRECDSNVVKAELLATIRSLRDFDSLYTVPVHGFSSVEEYYHVTSCRHYLRNVMVPTLLLHAKDDPFMTEDSIPCQYELSPHIELELYERGGHVGFVAGKYPWRPRYWLEERIPDYLKRYLNR